MKQRLNVIIISPSSYDDNGQLLQYYRILMRSPVQKVLASLAQAAAQKLGVQCQVVLFDERLEKGESYLEQIRQYSKEETIVFVTTRSYELSRSIDLARKLREFGFVVVLGGAGVTLSDWKTYQYMNDHGILFNVGEGEITVGQIIQDFLNGTTKPLYWQKEYVDILPAPLPALSEKWEHARCLNPLVGINSSEGCPFRCSYCCVIVLRGGNIAVNRARDPEAVVEWIDQTHQRGLKIFLADDNIRRSFHYEELKEKLIRLNEKRNGKLRIFIQIDAGAGIEKEIPSLARAGVNHVFMGMESLDPEVLRRFNKHHNRPQRYHEIAGLWRQHGVLVNSGVMLGFPNQTPQSMKEQVMLFNEILDLTSLFCVTPLPGSKDYEEAVKEGSLLTYDPNRFDTRHVCRNWFEQMSQEEAQSAFNQASIWATSVKHRLNGGRSPHLILRNLRNNLYGRAMAYWGLLTRGYPYLFMMDGIPRSSGIYRSTDSFRGFPLTAEDLAKKESFLQSYIQPHHG